MSGRAAKFIDTKSGDTYSLQDLRWRSNTGKPLMIERLPGIGRDDIDQSDQTLWRYRAALPIDFKQPVSLGEGRTPLVEKRWNHTNFLFKLEWFAPTGSFKDKGASVLISYLKHLAVPAILEDSSGNGGAALAAYGASADMDVRIITPESTQPAKITQMRVFGADVQLVPGLRQASEMEAIRQSEEIFYASHNWHPFFLQGTKMTAYEIWEDLGYRAPDNVVVPVGAGSNILGCDIGFSELLRAGQINRLPRLFGIQPENCAPLVARMADAGDQPVHCEFSPTLAEGASIRNPIRPHEVIDAIKRSEGKLLAVAEEDIIPTLLGMAEMGLFIEPTSAIAVAALNGLIADRSIKPDETTVVLLTGGGLKASSLLTHLFFKSDNQN